ncbi:response regulator transcription factor [Glaciecola petra]|uniref:Response regulator transcription factor n=1 Tax=Glaciecola petra TaxID=3075602 RepID=A0ABU2ZPN2_9ALTE|nr:response regulator transcription factor [Aestuariibacter sp. P117]MDT0594309.1 response regulator transcription factor [Aestuariibacter sp. P117]
MLKFLLADDHPLYREALRAALQSQLQGVNYLESDSFTSTLQVLRRQRNISVILLDLNMPGCENFYGLLRIRQSFPDIPIVVVSASDSIEVIAQVMDFGANAFVPKTTPTLEMVAAIKQVLSGQQWLPEGIAEKIENVSSDTIEIAQKVKELTPKQFQVLRLVKQGLMNKQIADTLNVTEATVKAHISMLFKRLNVKSRTQIIVAIEKLQLD